MLSQLITDRHTTRVIEHSGYCVICASAQRMNRAMKKIISLCFAALLALGSSASAQADRGRHYGHYENRGHHHHHRSSSHWAGPAALLAITGLAVGAAAYSSQAYSAPIYVAPPPPRPVQVVPDNGSWYYCGSSGQYYPYVRYCPEGWQQIMPPR
jgi:hypothetical protein